MNTEDKAKLIEFFSRDLNEKEKEEFLEKAGSDKVFLKELVKMTELNEGFEDIYGFKEKTENKSNGRFTRNISIILTFAAVIYFGLFFGIQRIQFKNDPGKYLFEENYEPFDITLTRSSEQISNPQDSKIPYLQLYSLYIQKEYETLIKVDLENLETADIKESAYVLLGISAIEVGDYEKAKYLFQQVSSNSGYASIARWYLLLLRVQDNQFGNIIPELDQFISEDLIFMGKAEHLKEQILKKGLIDR